MPAFARPGNSKSPTRLCTSVNSRHQEASVAPETYRIGWGVGGGEAARVVRLEVKGSVGRLWAAGATRTVKGRCQRGGACRPVFCGVGAWCTAGPPLHLLPQQACTAPLPQCRALSPSLTSVPPSGGSSSSSSPVSLVLPGGDLLHHRLLHPPHPPTGTSAPRPASTQHTPPSKHNTLLPIK